MVTIQHTIRSASTLDQTRIANLVYFETHVHRHLDWRTPLDWLGSPEYWLLEQNSETVAALACPPDPETISWLRLFATNNRIPLAQSWKALWDDTAQPRLKARGLTAAAIATHDWLTDLLLDSGFTASQNVVVLSHNQAFFDLHPNHLGLTLRPMTSADLPAVAVLDAAAFEPLWQNSLSSLTFALSQAEFSSIGLLDNQVIAYQMSTRNPFGAHLARLAVHPSLQGQGVGYLMVQNLLQQIRQAGLTRISVNTQDNNSASLTLYKKIGFRLTGEKYAVFTRTP